MPRQAVCPRHHGEHVRANGHVCAAQYIGRDTWDRAGWRHVPSDRPCRAIGRAQRGVILRTTLTFDDNVSLQPLAQTFPNLHSATELQTLSWRSVSDGWSLFFATLFVLALPNSIRRALRRLWRPVTVSAEPSRASKLDAGSDCNVAGRGHCNSPGRRTGGRPVSDILDTPKTVPAACSAAAADRSWVPASGRNMAVVPSNRRFKSSSLQRGVRCEPTFGGAPHLQVGAVACLRSPQRTNSISRGTEDDNASLRKSFAYNAKRWRRLHAGGLEPVPSQMPVRSRAISACAISGGISQA